MRPSREQEEREPPSLGDAVIYTDVYVGIGNVSNEDRQRRKKILGGGFA